MALERNRRRIFVKGLGLLEIREIDPTPATAFSDLGYLDGTTVVEEFETEDVVENNGNMIDLLPRIARASLKSNLLQSTKDEIDVSRLAAGKYYAVRYSGNEATDSWKYFLLPECRIVPGVNLQLVKGKRSIPIDVRSLDDTAENAFVVPAMIVNEAAAEIRTRDLALWVDPVIGVNAGTVKLLDISGLGRHGTIAPTADVAAIWQVGTPARFLRFDGVNDQVSFGDVDALDDDGTSDFVIEIWVRVQAANGTQQEIMSKKALVGDNSAGFSLYRDGNNGIVFRLGSGSASAAFASANGTVLVNVWKHVVVAVDRNGNGQSYIDGAASGSPASVAAIGTGTNAVNLYLGRDGTSFGQFDIGSVRIYKWAAGGLPTDIATIIARHFTAERAKYGI